MRRLGIDVGGSGIKGAPVDLRTGELLAKRVRLATPSPSTPDAVARTVAQIVEAFAWDGDAGCGFPGVVRNGVVLTAANVSKRWIGVSGADLLQSATGLRFAIVNDADAAGMAETRYGAAREQRGVTLVLTFGTGIGSALFVDGTLVPNVELGQLELSGRVAERWASEKARVDGELSFRKWSKRVNHYLARLEAHFWPDLIVVGGGASKHFERFASHLEVRCAVVPAALRNRAGIIGAALASNRATAGATCS